MEVFLNGLRFFVISLFDDTLNLSMCQLHCLITLQERVVPRRLQATPERGLIERKFFLKTPEWSTDEMIFQQNEFQIFEWPPAHLSSFVMAHAE